MFGFFDVIQDILSNLRTFGLRDVIDIAVVSLAMYQIFLFARKSRAGQLVRGLLLLLVFYALADVMQLRTVRWVLTNVMQIGFIAAIVLFQPELRRTLEHMGQSTNWTKLLFTTHRQDPTLRGAWQSAVVAICDAAEQLSDTRTGALMVLERMNNLDEIIRTGTPLSADVIPEMLGTIFYEGTPLHDGAVVIRDGRIVAAGCVLPLSNNLEMGKDMGTRHRAGLGMSENSDEPAAEQRRCWQACKNKRSPLNRCAKRMVPFGITAFSWELFPCWPQCWSGWWFLPFWIRRVPLSSKMSA